MKIDLEHLDGHNKKLLIEVPSDSVSTEFESYFRSLQKQVELKGFRKGKAPIDLVKKLYADSATSRVLQNIIENKLRDALREHELNPANVPQVNVESYIVGGSFKFSATFEAMPQVTVNDYSGLKLNKKESVVEAKEIDATLENVQKQLSTFEDLPPETAAVVGQTVVIDYEGSEAGSPVPEASDKDATFELGSGVLTPEFEKNIVGMKVGDSKNFSVKFPSSETPETATRVSGKTIDFSVTVRGLKNRILPAIDDEMAKKIGPFENLGVLRSRIEEDLKKTKENQNRRDLQDQAVRWLLENNNVDVPQSLINMQMEQLAIDSGMQLSQMGLGEKEIEERLKSWGPDMMDRAKKQVQTSMLLGAIARKENIQAGEPEVREEIARMALRERKSPQEVFDTLKEKGHLTALVRQITELKALDWLVTRSLGA